MKTNFLLLLFFCCACISVYGQELQSPQINQNAIFANPGLAGSKGQTRIGTTLNLVNNNYLSGWASVNYSLVSERYSHNKFYNGLISADGLILKNKLGIGGYIKNEQYRLRYEYVFYNAPSITNSTITNTFNYSNFNFGFMVAPKFYIHSSNIEKKGKTLSPAIGIGFKATQFSYSGNVIYTYNQDTIYKDGDRSKSLSLDYLSAGLLYSTSKSYIGIKFNFNTYHNSFFLYDISLVLARSYFNKTAANPTFSFNPQVYFSFPAFALRNAPLLGYYDRQNKHNLGSILCVNLDFRYKKILFGTFADITYQNGSYIGITGGVQLANAKIIINYAPKIVSNTHTGDGIFLSANFYLKAKKESYR